MKSSPEYRPCVLVPVYNNAATVLDVVGRCCLQAADVIVVNDGSTDATSSLLRTSSLPFTLVECPVNGGKGSALRQGFRKAEELGCTHVLTIDADGQHFPEEIPLLLKESSLHPEAVIIGSRSLVNENMPAGNTFANRFSNFWFTLQTGLRLPDTQTGFRVYPLRRLSGRKLMTSRYESELELLVFSVWAGVDARPVGVSVSYPEDRVSHFRPVRDFLRITVLNTFLCFAAILYGWPRMLIGKLLGRR